MSLFLSRVCAAGLLALSVAIPLTSQAQDDPGEALFTQRCAACHVNPDPAVNAHAPTREDMARFTPNSIYAALTDGQMRLQVADVSDEQLRAVARFLTGNEVSNQTLEITSNLCPSNPPLLDPQARGIWNGWGPDVHNTRFAENGGLSAADLPKLRLKWAYGLPGETQPRAQPAIVGGRVYVGNRAGGLYALDAESGCTYWSYLPRSGIRSALTVGPITKADGSAGQAVFFVDILANAYAVDAQTGEAIWVRQVESHPAVRGTGSVTLHEGRLYVPMTGITEETTSSNPDYSCCTFRGSLSSFDANTGDLVWKFYTIGEPQLRGKSSTGVDLYGPAGVGIWSAPTIDAARGLIYVATGNAYAEPAPPTANAILAIGIDSGDLVWSQQLTPNDAWISGCRPGTENPNCPRDIGPDFDFSASPALVVSPMNKEMLVVPQKSGLAFALDPANNGALLWQYRAGPGSAIGGVWGTAVAEGKAYVAVGGYQFEERGGIHAIDLDSGERRWFTPPQPLLCEPGVGCSQSQSAAVTAIPGAVFSGSADGGMRAYDGTTGEILWSFDANGAFDTINGVPANGGSFDGAGPVVADGVLYFLSGSGGFTGRAGNVLLAFEVEE
ncbi:MAG: PQQ-binding-like beta-propeller repeat protein [Pseudomonadales bacterium]|jgi:polyvinyl alcohol dehydrogenase (cytochrome)|nr:PQQ-binding-like beta-propeller repeat protein [Pseudomonadales bacterium]